MTGPSPQSGNPAHPAHSQPQEDCDLVMKGGITSGIVYPPAIEILSRKYRFRSIGGTSVGAMAAAAISAAEFYRQQTTSSDGFHCLSEDVKKWLQEDDNLLHLFQPSPNATAPGICTGVAADYEERVITATDSTIISVAKHRQILQSLDCPLSLRLLMECSHWRNSRLSSVRSFPISCLCSHLSVHSQQCCPEFLAALDAHHARRDRIVAWLAGWQCDRSSSRFTRELLWYLYRLYSYTTG